MLDDIEYWDVFPIYFLHNVLRKFAIDNLLFGTPFISCRLMYSFSQFLGCPGSMPGYCDCGVPKQCFFLYIKHWHQCHHSSSPIIILQKHSFIYVLNTFGFFWRGGGLQHSCELLCCIHFSLIRWGQTGGWFFIKLHFISLKHRLVQYITVLHVLIFCWLMCISKIYHLHWHATSAYWGLTYNVRNFVLTFRELQILFWTIDLAFI